ncbi:MAG: galactokinase [Chloroflexota bacterium]
MSIHGPLQPFPNTAHPPIIASAPGRVNMIGEHTDYSGGFVLPTAIPQRTKVELTPRDDRLVRVWSAGHSRGTMPDEYTLGAESPGRGWVDYIQGVTRALLESGHTLRGFDARISSTVPPGSGLSSSAALEVSLLRAVRQAFALRLDDIALAKIGQRAENEFVGAQVGIMDQMAASLADASTALLINTGSLEYRRVALRPEIELLVIHSGITHSHASGEYNRRRTECEQACQLLGVPRLSNCTLADLSRIGRLPEPLNRRAKHVVTENARVHDAVDAIEREDCGGLGRLLVASHESLRDDYNVSLAEIDTLVRAALADPDVYGARLTGGGFGGSIVALTRPGTAGAAGTRIMATYKQQTGRVATVIVPS